MSAKQELVELLKAERWKRFSYIDEDGNPDGGVAEQSNDAVADAILAAGYMKPRTITGPAQLEALPFGSAVHTSDESDTVVLRCEGRDFRNQSGYTVSVEDLWRYGTHPFIVLYEPEATK